MTQRVLQITLLISCFTIINQVVAQEKATGKRVVSSQYLEEVIVTARKRSENIQETPVAISAFTGDQLRERGIANAADLSKSVPGLQISNSKASQIFIRGIGQRAVDVRVEPAVSVYLDGILIPRLEGALLDTIDIESIQVLRGPQGTLFGKNNNGGALLVTLQKPHDQFEGFVDGTLGNLNAQSIKAGLNVPISSDFSARGAVSLVKRDGSIREISNGRDYDEDDRVSISLQSRWDASDRFSMTNLLFLDRQRATTHPVNCRVNNPDALLNKGLGLLWPGDTDPANPTAYTRNCESNSQAQLPDHTSNMGDPEALKLDLDAVMFGTNAAWEVGDEGSFKALLGYRTETLSPGKLLSDNDSGPGDFTEGMVGGDSDRSSLTLELQYTDSFANGALDLATGFFGQRTNATEPKFQYNAIHGLTAATLASLATGVDLGAVGGLLANADVTPVLTPLLGGPVRLADYEVSGEAFGLYTQLTWHISEQWEITAGGRYTYETKDSQLETTNTDLAAMEAMITSRDPRFQSTQAPGFMTYAGPWLDDPVGKINALLYDTDGNGYGNSPLQANAVVDKGSVSFKDFTPMVSASWFMPETLLDGSALDSGMVYFTWSNGFKSGFMEPAGADGLALVEPEKLENLEMGIKVDAFDRRLRLNLAFYEMTFEDMQLVQVTTDSIGGLVVRYKNAGESQIIGGEFELSWLPIPGLLVSLNYANNNYKFLEFMDTDIAAGIRGEQVVLDRSDENFPVSPEESAALGIQYDIETDVGTFIPRVDVSYKGDIYLGFDDGSWTANRKNKDLATASAYMLVDLRLTWRNNTDDLIVSGFINNALDNVYDMGSVSVADSLGTFTQIQGLQRTYGVSVRKEF